MKTYREYVEQWITLHREAVHISVPLLPANAIVGSEDRPVVVILSPHPDDEVIIGGLALRLMREAGFRVVNMAVTLGSNLNRRNERSIELVNCCRHIGFECRILNEGKGFEHIRPEAAKTPHFLAAVSALVGQFNVLRPQIIMYPHASDAHPAHMGTHVLAQEALKCMPIDFETVCVETEFWAPIAKPNLMVELTPINVADLIGALAFHVGEVTRNPYHLRFTSWLSDNVRRGAERVQQPGSPSPNCDFAILYHCMRWEGGEFQAILDSGQFIDSTQNPGQLFQRSN
jgi:LmbE family N-acetylglucosaminyl deacetylase